MTKHYCATIAAASAILLSSSALASGFSINASGWLTKNGVAEFPFGIYSVPTNTVGDNDVIVGDNAMESVSLLGLDHPINPYWAQDTGTSTATLAAINPYGLTGWVGFDDAASGWRTTLNTSWVTSYVNSIKNIGNLVGYVLPDEPYSTGGTHEKIKALYDAVKSADPTSPVVMVDYEVTPAGWKDSYDVFAYDEYPIGQESIQSFRSQFNSIVSAASPKPVWGILQAYVNTYNGAQWVEPTLDEMRAMFYMMVARGAKGMEVYMYDCIGGTDFNGAPGYCIKDHPTLWNNLTTLWAELDEYHYVWNMWGGTHSVSVTNATGCGIDYFRKQDSQGSIYVAVVNYKSGGTPSGGHYAGSACNNFTITVSGVTNADIVGLTGGATSTTTTNGSWTVSLGAYGAKLYRVDPY